MEGNNYKPVWPHKDKKPLVTWNELQEALNTLGKMPYQKKLECGLWEVFDGESIIYMSDAAYKRFLQALMSHK